ncbi:hypothetical protein ABW21_db0204674 [Orbilia brochopaga]|nr:hypothetical protein ABW21_db0204674 [Drechslerella brochopaga]
MGNCLSSRKSDNNNIPPENNPANAAAGTEQSNVVDQNQSLRILQPEDQPSPITTPRAPPRAAVAGSSRYRHLPLEQRPDEPLRRHEWMHDINNKGPAPTRRRLEQMREEFWHTRVTARGEVWKTVKTVVEMLQEDSSEDALATAREMLHAAEITVPSGDLVNAAYDIFGNQYKFPSYVLSNPTNMVPTPPECASKESLRSSSASCKSTDTSETTRQERRREKGKEVIVGETTAPVDFSDVAPNQAIFRMSTDGLDHSVGFWAHEPLKDVAARLIDLADIDRCTHRVKLMLAGHELKLDKSLVEQNWAPAKIIVAITQDLRIVAPWMVGKQTKKDSWGFTKPVAPRSRMPVFPPALPPTMQIPGRSEPLVIPDVAAENRGPSSQVADLLQPFPQPSSASTKECEEKDKEGEERMMDQTHSS